MPLNCPPLYLKYERIITANFANFAVAPGYLSCLFLTLMLVSFHEIKHFLSKPAFLAVCFLERQCLANVLAAIKDKVWLVMLRHIFPWMRKRVYLYWLLFCSSGSDEAVGDMAARSKTDIRKEDEVRDKTCFLETILTSL